MGRGEMGGGRGVGGGGEQREIEEWGGEGRGREERDTVGRRGMGGGGWEGKGGM